MRDLSAARHMRQNEYIEDPVKFGATEHAVAYVKSTRHLQDDIVSFFKAA